MDLFSRFKKDYFNYLISIILPAIISGISIPVFKNLLGSKGYGNFSIWLNAILIITAVLSGWILQSILRFYPGSENKYIFSRTALILSLRTQAIFFLPVFLFSYYISSDFILAFFVSTTLVITSLQFTIIPIIQSGFLSKKIIFSETIRIITYVLGAILLLKYSGFSYLHSLFLCVMVSYLISVIYLIKQSSNFFVDKNFVHRKQYELLSMYRQFFKFGAPLSLWFVFSYLLTYMDKFFMNRYMGASVQGEYQAIFDLLSRSITLIISPIIASIYPVLSSAYSEGNKKEINRLLKRIISYEIIGFILCSILYWWFGSDVLFKILKTPDSGIYRLIGFLVIAATFIFQISILVQKRLELQLKSRFLLKMIFIAFCSQIIFYIVFRNSKNELIFPLGYLISSSVYLFLVSIKKK